MAYTAYLLFDTGSYALNPEQFFRPYSKILFVLFITFILMIIKYKNWKSKVKILTLWATLIFILFNTFLQLQNLFTKGSEIVNYITKLEDPTIANIEALNPWIASKTQFEIYYRLGKIVLLDIFAIFAFFAINKTVNELEETKE